MKSIEIKEINKRVFNGLLLLIFVFIISKANAQDKPDYPFRNRIWAIEGDSPAFFYLFSNGLNNPGKIDQGGWGGRFSLTKVSGIRVMDITQKSGVDESKYDPYLMYTNTSEGVDAITRWKQHIWNNMAARMKWSVTYKYKDANHHPVACLNGDNTRQVLEYTVEVNSKIRLDAN
ncbi:nucleoside hydrolase-like domain-containing protein [uncultured Draconibacterium sp.]|uniref:nucleoside hydrolase-like domain-containing protein n=1 Tax=uncultured Draconibacterium sp. TaxID=1573823 RepID=UPI003217CDB2